MKRLISESAIRRIVSETLNKFILSETFTNMKQLYHKTPIDSLLNIIRTNSFFLVKSNHSGRGGQYYASLTRHKNDIEGFNALSYAENKENEIESYATITFNIPKLSRVHGISIKPFDFYGTYSDERNHHEYGPVHGSHGHDFDVESVDDYDNGIYSKVLYQLLHKQYDDWTDEEIDEWGGPDYDDPEYYNMAEENIVSDTVKEIPNIFNYIDRIDIYFPPSLTKENIYKEYNPYSDEYEDEFEYNGFGYDKTYSYAHALCDVTCGTAWENKIVINFMGSNNSYKPMSISEFKKWLNQKEDYEKHSDVSKQLLDKEPQKRDGFHVYGCNDDDDDYYGHGHGYGYGHSYGHGRHH